MRPRWFRPLWWLVAGIQKNLESAKGSEDKTEGSAWLAFFDLNDPLSTDADFIRQRALIETQLAAASAYQGAQLCRTADTHE